VAHFEYDSAFVVQAVACKSTERLTKYLEETENDQASAMRLYSWNIAMSAALYGPIQAVEVSLRNAFDQQLTTRFGVDWWCQPRFLMTDFIRRKIEGARRHLLNERKSIDKPHVIAALTFGFWAGLTGKGARNRHDMFIWRPALHRAFDRRLLLDRATVYKELSGIRGLRNRVAHHEPLIRLDVALEYDRLRRVLLWVAPAMIPWVDHHSRVTEVLSARPMAERF
jgi:hypothetical protein